MSRQGGCLSSAGTTSESNVGIGIRHGGNRIDILIWREKPLLLQAKARSLYFVRDAVGLTTITESSLNKLQCAIE